MSASIRKRQADNLAQLTEIRESGFDDNGHPLSVDALQELDVDIATLKRVLNTRARSNDSCGGAST